MGTENRSTDLVGRWKVKVVVTVWGTELIQFLAVIAIFHQDDLKKGMNSSYSSYRPGAIHPIRLIIL